MRNGHELTDKEVVVAYFQSPSRYLTRRPQKNHGNFGDPAMTRT